MAGVVPPRVGGRLVGRRRTGLSARARRRVPAVRERDPHRVATGEPQRGGARLRRSVSRPGALAERLSATGYRRPLEADNRFAARKGRVNFRQTLWLVGAGHHEHPVAGHPVAAGERRRTPRRNPTCVRCAVHDSCTPRPRPSEPRCSCHARPIARVGAEPPAHPPGSGRPRRRPGPRRAAVPSRGSSARDANRSSSERPQRSSRQATRFRSP